MICNDKKASTLGWLREKLTVDPLFVLGVVNGSKLHFTVEMVKKFPRELPVGKLVAPLDTGKVRGVGTHAARDVGKGLAPGDSSFTQIHSGRVCVSRKPTSSAKFASRALRLTLDLHEITGFMEATKRVRADRRGAGWAIRKLRIAQRRTLEDLAGAIGTDAGNLSRVERGAQDAPEGALMLIAAELGVRVSDLYALAEGGDDEAIDVMARVGKMKAAQLKELASYADYLLKREK